MSLTEKELPLLEKSQPLVAGREEELRWSGWQKFLFRIAFLFFMTMALPTSWDWVQRILEIDWLHMNYRDLYEVAGYSPKFFKVESESGRWGIASYAVWGVILLGAIAGAAVWSLFDQKRDNYRLLYYWLRVVVRYRIAVGIISFGYVKLFPSQMPYPSLSVFNTNLGDILAKQHYWNSVGLVSWYQVFLGFVEIFGGVLLFSRKTTALGAVFTAGVLFNIAYANHAYDGGVHVYSAYFVVLSLFLLIYHIPHIWNLLVMERDVADKEWVPVLSKKWQTYGKSLIKYGIVIVYVPLFFYIRLYNHFYAKDPLQKEPSTPGLSGATGVYNVTEFRLNDRLIPYSPVDTVRWQDVIFENWSTLTYKVNRPVRIDLSNGGPQQKDVEKNYELAGIGGGRRFFYYEADTTHHLLTLWDKNKAFTGNSDFSKKSSSLSSKNIERQKNKTDNSRLKLQLNYQRVSASRIILSGLNEQKDSIYVVLDKVAKRYPILEIPEPKVAKN
jgi:hypothetical protein